MTCLQCGRTVKPSHWYRSGLPRCWKRRWTRARLWKLMEGIERGWTDERLARSLGTTTTAVNLARKRNGIASRTETLLSARTAAERIGVKCAKTVARWIEAGWLNGKQGPPRGGNRQWQIHPDDLLTFMENPDHWHRWNPERICDTRLRTWATELRQGVRFLTVGEAAYRSFVQVNTFNNWIRKGWIPAVRNGNWMVRESDLERFVLPQIGGPRKSPAGPRERPASGQRDAA